MKNKKLLIGAGVIAVSVAVGSIYVFAFHKDSTQDETLNMINKGEQIEIEVAEPNFTEQGEDSEITWVQLGQLESYLSFRTAFDNAFGITSKDGIKEGAVYVDAEGKQTNNSTLYNAFMNKAFVDKWNNEDIQSQIKDGISNTYADIEESDYTAAIINAYFNLLDDNTPNYFNGGASLTRGEAMTLVMRAVTPVEDLKENEAFKSLVGDSEYTGYAGYMNDYCYINTSDKSISKQNFNGSMTKAEFIYMVMKYTYGKDAVSKFDASKVSLNDCKDAGNIAESKEFSGKDYCNSYVMNEMVKNPDSGVTTEIYKAIAMAKDKDIISGETSWDESISKTEAIEIIVSAFESVGSKVEAESGEVNTEAYTKEAKELYNAEKDNLSCTEAELTNTYVSLRQQGTSAEDAKANCLTEFMKRPEVQDNTNVHAAVTDEEIDEYIKNQEEKENNKDYKYKYEEDINCPEDARNHLTSLGYKVSNPVTSDEIRAIHKGTGSKISTQELEDGLKANQHNLILLVLAKDTLTSNGVKNTQTNVTAGDSVRPSEENKDKVESTWKPSKETGKKGSSIYVDSKDVHHDSIENLDPGLNDLFD